MRKNGGTRDADGWNWKSSWKSSWSSKDSGAQLKPSRLGNSLFDRDDDFVGKPNRDSLFDRYWRR